MLLEARARGWEVWYLEQGDLSLQDDRAFATMRRLEVWDEPTRWHELDLGSQVTAPLSDLQLLLMRKDPPFDMEYIYTTYILDHAQRAGVLVVNRTDGLRAANEKAFITHFPQCIPPTLVTRRSSQLLDFIREYGEVVLKPLDGMGGASVFVLRQGDRNVNVVIETLTQNGSHFTMAQRFIPEITQGDKRILLIDGEPIPYALARIPKEGESRGNLAVGATARGVELSDRERWICEQVGPTLREMGLIFVGLDVIGDYLTEINVTSPTCIRELDRIFSLNIAGQLLDRLEARL